MGAMDRTGFQPVQSLALKPTAFQASLKTKAKGRAFQAVGSPTWLKPSRQGEAHMTGIASVECRPIPAQPATHLAPRGALGRLAPVEGHAGLGCRGLDFGVF